ncbi:Rrf2 family transcriptional regulator [uncultured Sphingomonas sp.]|uniref:RrF2 family transcriptional regulator n=1 Tax=uncultured Sphingomonas sp. TaxID=158754 RepID=UPI00260123F7|nr:Rrf2 family transcriptional regulator [uncultured Sphingomonas sp.]
MRLTAQADYAVVLLAAAARHCGVSGRLNATVIAEETGLPLPTVQKLVSRLSAAGLIDSARGTGGGFRLARPPATITLADIVEAIEGPIGLTTCVDPASHDCAVGGTCHVRPHMGTVNGAVRSALAGITLTQFSSPAQGTHQSTTLMGPKAGVQSQPVGGWTPAFAGEQV